MVPKKNSKLPPPKETLAVTSTGVLCTQCQPHRCLKTSRCFAVFTLKKNFQLARAFGFLTLPPLAHFHACHLLSRFLPPNLPSARQTLNPKISLLLAGLIALDFLLLLLTRAFPFSITESTAAGYPWQEKKKGKKEPFLGF